MNSNSKEKRPTWQEWVLFAAMIVLFGSMAYAASVKKSAAFDEQYHLAAGTSYLATGDFRLASTHPPLAGLLAATGLPRQGYVVPLEHNSWHEGNLFAFADEFLWRANTDAQALLIAGRVPIIMLACILLAGIWLWAREMWGRWPAWVALWLAVFDPNVLANSRLITSDLPLTAFLFGAMWWFWRWLKWPSFINLLLVGLFGGLAMGSKFTGLLFWPVALLCLLIAPERDQHWRSRLAGFAGMGLVGIGTLWVVYRFDIGPVDSFPLAFAFPAPFFWESLLQTFVKLPVESAAKLNFLLGNVSAGGWWYYFPVALLVKTPLATLLLAMLGGWMALHDKTWREKVCVWLLPLAFLTLGMTGVLTIGYRHILPAVPFLLLLAGYAGGKLAQIRSRGRLLPQVLLALLLFWSLFRTARIHPHQEAYFNELAGNWTNWSNILVDSNLDWGQDLILLRHLMHDFGLAEVNLAYFGMAYPEQYGIKYRPLPGYLKFVTGPEIAAFNSFTPAPGWYAISATSLRLGALTPETAATYTIFQEMEPVGRAGYSIYLYYIAEDVYAEVNRIVVNSTPAVQLSAMDLGIQPGQRTVVKWAKSAGTTIYPLGEGFAEEYTPVGANFADVMTLLGVKLERTAVSSAQPLNLILYWQVGHQTMPAPSPAVGPPLSAFVHLTGEEKWQIVAQHDGWETALRGLEASDIIAQPVTLLIPADIVPGNYSLLVGLYSPQTMMRLQPAPYRDYVQLEEITVE
jgi:hypothetical protein